MLHTLKYDLITHKKIFARNIKELVYSFMSWGQRSRVAWSNLTMTSSARDSWSLEPFPYISQIPALSAKTVCSGEHDGNHVDDVITLCLSAALCTGQTGTERLRRSRARRWTVRTAGWWCPTASVCQTRSRTTRLRGRCAGRMQVHAASSVTAAVKVCGRPH